MRKSGLRCFDPSELMVRRCMHVYMCIHICIYIYTYITMIITIIKITNTNEIRPITSTQGDGVDALLSETFALAERYLPHETSLGAFVRH